MGEPATHETLDAERRERLPKWARQELARLERDLSSATARLASGPEDSRVFADPYSDAPRPLGNDPRIEFQVGEEWTGRITVRIEGDGIEVMGGSRLAITPSSSNVVHIRAVA